MKPFSKYWIATAARGVLALIAATGILVFPQMASTILLLPFAVVISILCLAAYGTLDSAVLFASSFLIPGHRSSSILLRVQGVLGAGIGVFLFALIYARADLRWFVYLASFQAASTAVTEFLVARETILYHGARWCYASSAVAAVAAAVLLSGSSFGPAHVAWLLYGYLGVFGFNLLALASWMLFASLARVLEPVSA